MCFTGQEETQVIKTYINLSTIENQPHAYKHMPKEHKLRVQSSFLTGASFKL